ncbi:MAG TPA: FAD binding domain-containing protein [Bryobacteraceae bacterium]|nr:FAD binding domain-containing protein [Bryobacteraceae bacterium]
MDSHDFEFSTPGTLEELIELLSDPEKKPLVGDMSVIPLMKLRFARPSAEAGLRSVRGLNEIKEEGGSIRIGPAATHLQIESSPLLRNRCPLLPETATHAGGRQTHSAGTIGASVSHSDPVSDYPAALLALEAKLHVVGKNSDRIVAARDFLSNTAVMALEPGELLMETTVPVEDSSTGVHYERVSNPDSDFTVVGVAARIRRAEGKIAMARVGVTGLAARAFRAVNVEQALEGTPGSETDISNAAALVGEGVDARSDVYGSADQRRQLARLHTERAISEALRKAA